MKVDDKLIDSALEYIRQLFREDFSGHDYYHSLRVYRLACHLAESEGADIGIVSLAALLHDADDRKLSPETCETKQHAMDFLKQHGISDSYIRKIVEIIAEVSFAGTDSAIPCSIEGKCVQDADRLDALGAIGIARTFAYGGSRGRELYTPEEPPKQNMTGEEYRNHVSSSLNHFYEKLFLLKDMMNTTAAKEIARERDRYMHAFAEEFLREWQGEC